MEGNVKKEKTGKGVLKGSSLWGILLFLILITVDQIVKILADVYFIDYAPDVKKIVIIPDMIELCISYNRGIAFSMFSTSNVMVKMGIVLSTGVMMIAIAIAYFKIDKRRTMLRLACVFIVAGGIGNLIDRVYYQVWDPATATGIRDGVRDMVRVNIVFDFGVCNFADFFIVGGAVLLVLACLFFDSYAYAPQGKYKELQVEAEAKEKEKEEAKKAKKLAEKKLKELKKDSAFDGACSVGVIGEPDEEPQKKESEEEAAEASNGDDKA